MLSIPMLSLCWVLEGCYYPEHPNTVTMLRNLMLSLCLESQCCHNVEYNNAAIMLSIPVVSLCWVLQCCHYADYHNAVIMLSIPMLSLCWVSQWWVPFFNMLLCWMSGRHFNTILFNISLTNNLHLQRCIYTPEIQMRFCRAFIAICWLALGLQKTH